MVPLTPSRMLHEGFPAAAPPFIMAPVVVPSPVLRPACPKQADLAPQTPTFQHSCFQATRPSQLIDGNLVVLLDNVGYPAGVVQYRAQSLWSSTGSQEYGSIISLVYTLTSMGIDTFAASQAVVWPLRPIPIARVKSLASQDLSNIIWSSASAREIIDISQGTFNPPSHTLGGAFSPASFSKSDFGSASQTQRDRSARAASWIHFVKDI